MPALAGETALDFLIPTSGSRVRAVMDSGSREASFTQCEVQARQDVLVDRLRL